jgi:chromosome partitioning protein
MIVTVGNTKGGVGKTTIAVNLAAGLALRGRDALLIDGDSPQYTALAFTQLRADRRGAAGYTAIALQGAAIRTQVRQQLAQRYGDIVIDVGGRDTASLRAALTVSDLLVIPAVPRSFDLWGVDATAELAREAREVNSNLRAVAVLNCADFQSSDNRDALAQLGEVEGIEVAAVSLVRRKAYSNAAALGLSVLEHSDSSNPVGAAKARSEFAALLESLFPTAKENTHDRKKTNAKGNPGAALHPVNR